MATRKRVTFVHPDLGIGGAERLVVDAAVGLQELGHEVSALPAHYGATHAVAAARGGACTGARD